MANICSIDMRIKGTKENIQSMINALKQNGGVWIGRGVNIECIDDEYDYEDNEDGTASVSCTGDCKWSITSALINNAIDMREHPDNWFFGDNVDKSNLTFLTLGEASELYDVDIEMYSEEPCCCFAEHYLVKHGKTLIKDCVDFYEFNMEDTTIEEVEEEIGRKLTQDEINSIEPRFNWLYIGFDKDDWNI